MDTVAFSDLVRERAEVVKRLSQVAAEDSVVICPTVRGEVLYGIERLPVGKRRRELEEKIARMFVRAPTLDTPAEAGDHYARIKVAQEKSGVRLDENDLWVAATALALGAVLVTRDSDLARVEGLTTEDWTR